LNIGNGGEAFSPMAERKREAKARAAGTQSIKAKSSSRFVCRKAFAPNRRFSCPIRRSATIPSKSDRPQWNHRLQTATSTQKQLRTGLGLRGNSALRRVGDLTIELSDAHIRGRLRKYVRRYQWHYLAFGFILSVTMAIGLLIYLVIATTPPEHY
jgi:hypothetical protein